ncbi:DinB family protein [Streptomyces sp. NPDC017941]|uniref:DinB family protein n=1 Tax=Streptomyces sp. NPDC017941 TaxID=3365018 RepID=UPI0037A73B75
MTETRELLTALREQRDTLRITLRGLADDQLAVRSTVSELTLGGIVNHLTRGERSWTHVLSSGTGGTPPGMFDMEQYETPPGATVTALLTAYEEAARATDDAVARVGLDRVVPLPEAPWEPGVVPRRPVRWIVLRLLRETAQHAGHADIVREAIDGASTTAQLGD